MIAIKYLQDFFLSEFKDTFNALVNTYLRDTESWVIKLETMYYVFIGVFAISAFMSIAFALDYFAIGQHKDKKPLISLKEIRWFVFVAILSLIIALLIPEKKTIVIMYGFEELYNEANSYGW